MELEVVGSGDGINRPVTVLLSHKEYQLALDWLDKAEARSPGFRAMLHLRRANTLRMMGRCSEALPEFAKVPGIRSYMQLSMAICYSQLGQVDKAKALVRDVAAKQPELTLTALREGSFFSDPAVLDAELSELEKLGLPE